MYVVIIKMDFESNQAYHNHVEKKRKTWDYSGDENYIFRCGKIVDADGDYLKWHKNRLSNSKI